MRPAWANSDGRMARGALLSRIAREMASKSESICNARMRLLHGKHQRRCHLALGSRPRSTREIAGSRGRDMRRRLGFQHDYLVIPTGGQRRHGFHCLAAKHPPPRRYVWLNQPYVADGENAGPGCPAAEQGGGSLRRQSLFRPVITNPLLSNATQPLSHAASGSAPMNRNR